MQGGQIPWLLMQQECTISLGYKQQRAGGCLHQELIVNTQDICGPVVINCQQLEIGRGGNFIPQKSANATNQGFPHSPHLTQSLFASAPLVMRPRAR